MSDVEYTFEPLTDPNEITVRIDTERDCNIHEGEYSVFLLGTKYPVELDPPGGETHFYLVTECIAENLDKLNLPEEGYTTVKFREAGEWQDVFFVRWYELLGIIEVQPA